MTLVYSRQAAKDIKNLPSIIQKRALAGIEDIGKNPLVGKKLKGPLAAYRNLRVGEYRIIYEVTNKPQQVIIMTVQPRGEGYKG